MNLSTALALSQRILQAVAQQEAQLWAQLRGHARSEATGPTVDEEQAREFARRTRTTMVGAGADQMSLSAVRKCGQALQSALEREQIGGVVCAAVVTDLRGLAVRLAVPELVEFEGWFEAITDEVPALEGCLHAGAVRGLRLKLPRLGSWLAVQGVELEPELANDGTGRLKLRVLLHYQGEMCEGLAEQLRPAIQVTLLREDGTTTRTGLADLQQREVLSAELKAQRHCE